MRMSMRGVAPIVAALARFPKLRTIESCEGNPERGAWVCFDYGEDGPESWRDLAEFVLDFSVLDSARKSGTWQLSQLQSPPMEDRRPNFRSDRWQFLRQLQPSRKLCAIFLIAERRKFSCFCGRWHTRLKGYPNRRPHFGPYGARPNIPGLGLGCITRCGHTLSSCIRIGPQP